MWAFRWATRSRSEGCSFFLSYGFYLTQVIRVGSKCLYLGSHLAGSQILKKNCLFYVFMYVCSICMCTLRSRRSQIREVDPLDWSYRQVMSHHVGAGNQTLVLRKISKCSELLSSVPPPIKKGSWLCFHFLGSHIYKSVIARSGVFSFK